MATLKHIASKNSDYDRSIEYLVFEHSENGKPVHDANGSRVMRDRFILEGINCNPFAYDGECRMLNRQYHKNRKPGDIKSHHYIISFDPKDREEGLLTMDRAQELGKEFAGRCFPGHQILVCTHNDGHNESGNIHVHIIFNSLRKLDVERKPFMEREIDSRAGYKHHPTDAFMEHIKKELMQICEREGLHQVDLLSPARSKVTDREYRVNQRGQKKLDEENKEIIEAKMTPTATVFQTQKQYLRDAVRDSALRASSLQEFARLLKDSYGIELKDRRGRFSYLHPDRKKFITDRALGSDFEKDHVMSMILNESSIDSPVKEIAEPAKGTPASVGKEDDEKTAGRNSHPITDSAFRDERGWNDSPYPAAYDPSYDYHADPIAILYIRSHLRLVTDLQNCIKAKQSAVYAQKVKVSNLKEMARTVVFIQENGFDTREDLLERKAQVDRQVRSADFSLQEYNDEMRRINAQIHFTGQYYANRSVHADFLRSRQKKRFKETHHKELDLYDEAVHFFEDNYEGSIPSLKDLKYRKEQLALERESLTDDLATLKKNAKELQTAVTNVDMILGSVPERAKTRKKDTLEL
ncbi:MAG: relaxase/mobilization nuclease domain-containing protein [Oscillospiraceae bacterium]|nr:relaxase/mobilization nuclease domain-containing protein [Oscillospiraceae bacterium]